MIDTLTIPRDGEKTSDSTFEFSILAGGKFHWLFIEVSPTTSNESRCKQEDYCFDFRAAFAMGTFALKEDIITQQVTKSNFFGSKTRISFTQVPRALTQEDISEIMGSMYVLSQGYIDRTQAARSVGPPV